MLATSYYCCFLSLLLIILAISYSYYLLSLPFLILADSYSYYFLLLPFLILAISYSCYFLFLLIPCYFLFTLTLLILYINFGTLSLHNSYNVRAKLRANTRFPSYYILNHNNNLLLYCYISHFII